jgi:hypothetical protein
MEQMFCQELGLKSANEETAGFFQAIKLAFGFAPRAG